MCPKPGLTNTDTAGLIANSGGGASAGGGGRAYGDGAIASANALMFAAKLRSQLGGSAAVRVANGQVTIDAQNSPLLEEIWDRLIVVIPPGSIFPILAIIELGYLGDFGSGFTRLQNGGGAVTDLLNDIWTGDYQRKAAETSPGYAVVSQFPQLKYADRVTGFFNNSTRDRLKGVYSARFDFSGFELKPSQTETLTPPGVQIEVARLAASLQQQVRGLGKTTITFDGTGVSLDFTGGPLSANAWPEIQFINKVGDPYVNISELQLGYTGDGGVISKFRTGNVAISDYVSYRFAAIQRAAENKAIESGESYYRYSPPDITGREIAAILDAFGDFDVASGALTGGTGGTTALPTGGSVSARIMYLLGATFTICSGACYSFNPTIF
jgi:hypothetical protein